MSKVEKRKKRLAFLNSLVCRYTLLITQRDTYGSIFSVDSVSKICQESIESKLCIDEYIDERISFYISNMGLDLPSDERLVYNLTGRFIQQISGTNLYGEITNQSQSINYILGVLREYIANTGNDTLKINKKYICSLLVNAISLNLSLNDNYIKSFILFLFLQNVIFLMTGETEKLQNFTLNVITEMETINSTQTRPFVKKFAPIMLDTLMRACDAQGSETDICIRGGVACHLNMCEGKLDCVNSNDVDVMIFADNSAFINNFSQMIAPLLQEYGEQYGVRFTNILVPMVDDDRILYQIIAEYKNPNSYSIYAGQTIIAENVLPIVKHHVLEVGIYNKRVDKTNWNLLGRGSNTSLYYINKNTLIKEFNIIINEGLHWYRKSKYMRRIAALNGIMSDKALYNLYESEFTV